MRLDRMLLRPQPPGSLARRAAVGETEPSRPRTVDEGIGATANAGLQPSAEANNLTG